MDFQTALADFQTAIRTCLNKYATFEGRAGRAEFWYFYLMVFLIGIVFLILENIIPGIVIIQLLVNLALLIPTIAVAVRRFHDVDTTGWMALLFLIPVIGFIVAAVLWLAKPGDALPNKFGPPTTGLIGDVSSAL